MRESNYKVVSANKAAVSITSTLYDRRALDCSEDKPLINSLNHLTFLASSSGKVREALASDGGLERLIVILHECKNPKNVKEQCLAAWKWILAFQCLVLVGTRGTEKIRIRVVEAGIIPVIATILDNYILSTKSTWMQKINSKPQDINQSSLKNPHLLSSSNINRQQQTTNINNTPTTTTTTPTSTTPTPTPAPSNQTTDQDIQEIFRNTRMLMQQANDTIQQTQEVIQNINNDNDNIRQTTTTNSISNSNSTNIDSETMGSSNDIPMTTEVNDTEELENIKLENNESEIPKSDNNMTTNNNNSTNNNNNNNKNNCKSNQKWLGDGHKLFKSVLLLHFLNKMNTTDDLTSINKELKDNYSLLMDDGPFATQLLNSQESFNILHLNLENGNTDLKDTNFFKEVITPRQIPREFSNGLLIPKEDDVIWSLQLLAFISKYTSLRNELSSTYIISGLSFRTIYHQQQQQEKERQRNQLVKNIHDQSQNHYQQQQQQQQQQQRLIDSEAQKLKQLIQQLEKQDDNNNDKQNGEIHISYEELVNLKSRLQQHQEKVRLQKLQKSFFTPNQQPQTAPVTTTATTTSSLPLFAQLKSSNESTNPVAMNSNSNPSGEVYGSNALGEAISSSDDFYDYESDLQSDDVLSKKISNSSFKNGSESDESTNSYSTTVSSSMYSSLNINESNKYDFLFEDIREIYKCNNDDMDLGDSNGDVSTDSNGNSEINENSIGMMEKFMGNTNVFNGTNNFTISKFSEKERLRRATILEKLSLKVSRNIKEERMKLRTKNRKMYFTRKSYYKQKWNYKTWKDFEINREDHKVLSVTQNNINICPMHHHKSTASYSASGNYTPSTNNITTATSNVKQEQSMQRNQDYTLFSVDSPNMSSSFSSPSPNNTTSSSSSNGSNNNKSTIAAEKSLDTDLFPIKRLNVFPLVEKFTVKQLNPKEICYWATVIVRNSNKKDESKGGRRQCAFFGCGKWETTPRQFAKCRRCKRAKYCSKDCQSKAWTYHKYWCSAPNSASSTTSSTSTSTSNPVATVPQPVGGMTAHIGPTGMPIFTPVQPSPANTTTQQPNNPNMPQDSNDANTRVLNNPILANNNTSSSSIDSNSSLERSGLEGRSDAVSSLSVSSSQTDLSYAAQQQQSNAQQQRTSCISALAQRFRGCQHVQRVHSQLHNSRQQRQNNNQPQNTPTLSSLSSSSESALTDSTSMNNNARVRNTCIPLPFIARSNHISPNRFFGNRGGLPAVQTDNLSTLSPSASSSSSSSQILGSLRESELQLRRVPSMIEADSRPDTPTTTVSSPPNFVSIVDSDSNIDDGSSTVNLTNQVPGNMDDNDNENESQTIHNNNAGLSRSTTATLSSSSQISNSQLDSLEFHGSSSLSGSSSQFPSQLTSQFQFSSRSSQNPFETQSNNLIPFANALYRQASTSASESASGSASSSQSSSDNRTISREKFGNMQLKRSDTIELPNYRERMNQQQLGRSSNSTANSNANANATSNSNFRLLSISGGDQSDNSTNGAPLNSLLSSFESHGNNNNSNNNNNRSAGASNISTDGATYNDLLTSHSLNTINDNSITTLTSIPDGYHSINTINQNENNTQVQDSNNLYDSNNTDLMDVDTNN